MKKILCSLLVLCLIFACTTAFAQELSGGWTLCDPAAPIPEDALSAFEKAMDGLTGVSYTPAALLEEQVVAGMNYCLLCSASAVVPDAVPYWAVVTVYAGVDGTCEILAISPIDPLPAE
ncbi:MAG: hypothetical protein MJ078_08615 [Clostridia bacterium]|nr:hypothetical protein [Clostridia bacterium]